MTRGDISDLSQHWVTLAERQTSSTAQSIQSGQSPSAYGYGVLSPNADIHPRAKGDAKPTCPSARQLDARPCRLARHKQLPARSSPRGPA